MEISLKILPHAEGLALPHYATSQSAGMDLLAAVQTPMTIAPHSTALVPTGLCLALPAGYEAQVRPRSGLALKNAVTVLNSPGTIDADYRGEVSVILINHSTTDFVIERGMRIAQMVIAKHETTTWNVVQDLDETARGTGGFGSTGVKST